MKRQKLTALCLALAAAGLGSEAALATDGYFANGYGMKSIGMGGAAIAVAQEPFGGAINPGAMSFLDSQWQLGAAWFSPHRSASRTGSGLGNIDANVDSDSNNFFIPEFGINWKYSPDLALGVTVYGNGGMNTDYPGGQISNLSACTAFWQNHPVGPYNLLCGQGNLGVDLMQLMIAPYVSWQFVKGHSVGVTPVIAYQRFKAEGLQVFDNPVFSTSPGNVTNNGYDDSWGVGVRVGYMGQLTDWLAIGGAWQSKISMGNFDKYKGLFAQQGGFDIPSTFTVGIGVRPVKELLFAVDYQRIYYDDAPSVNNPSANIGSCVPPALGGRWPAQLLPRRRQRRRLRLAERRRLEDRRPIRHERRLDAARRLQPHRQSDRAAGRHVQHPRAGRGPEPVLGGRNLADRQGVRNHRRVHVRGEQLGDRTEPLRSIRRAADDDRDHPDEGIPARHRLQPQVLTSEQQLPRRAPRVHAVFLATASSKTRVGRRRQRFDRGLHLRSAPVQRKHFPADSAPVRLRPRRRRRAAHDRRHRRATHRKRGKARKQLAAHPVELRKPEMERRLGVAVDERGQRRRAIGQVVARRSREHLGPPTGKACEHRLPFGRKVARGAVLAQLVQDQRFRLDGRHRSQRRVGIVGEPVGVERRGERTVGALALPCFGPSQSRRCSDSSRT